LRPALICINAAAPAAGKIGTHPAENLMNTMQPSKIDTAPRPW
jgi:hypothetical protein